MNSIKKIELEKNNSTEPIMDKLYKMIGELPNEIINHISEFKQTQTEFKTKLTIVELLELDLLHSCRYWIVKKLIECKAVVEVEIFEDSYDEEDIDDIKVRHFEFTFDLSDWGYDDGIVEVCMPYYSNDKVIKLFQLGEFIPNKE